MALYDGVGGNQRDFASVMKYFTHILERFCRVHEIF